MDYHKLPATKIVELVKTGKATAVDIAKDFLTVMKAKDPKIKAMLRICEKEALEQAHAVDDKIASGEDAGLLAGVPYVLKDNYLTEGIETTSASRILKGYIPQYSAEMYTRLKSAGAVLLGKANLDTFAFGASTENSGYFTTHNPHDLERVPGGSSGGSAAAVAANMCAFALGSDTGGSIRQPSAFCGTVGLKATYGRNSRYGMTAMASSFDTPGPIANTVEDIALVLQVMAGVDEKDSTTSPTPVPDYLEKLEEGINVKGLKIGLPKEYFIEGMQSEVEEAVRAAAKRYEEMGAELVEISLPYTEYGLAVYYVLIPCEVSTNMARYDGIRFGPSVEEAEDINDYYMKTRGKYMEPELKRRIMIGSYALSAGYYDAYYLKAAKVRTLIREDFRKAFEKVDVILAPTTPTTAFKIGEKANDPVQMYLSDIFTVCSNVAGIPSVNIPVGKDEKGLPIGAQIIGNYFEEGKILKVAKLLGKNTR